MTKSVNLVLIMLVLGLFCVPSVFAQTTEISYQGNLRDTGALANANYDFEFRLYDALTGGTQIGAPIPLSQVAVTDGSFSVKLDFGPNGFPGQDRYLEIAVRRTGVGSLVTLGPRQKISSAPYAVRSLTAGSATTASIANNATSLGGVAASQYVLSADPRMTDARNPLPGSSNYVQNTNTQQAATNFNIAGNGTASTFNATTRYNFNGAHLLSAPGVDNIFAGSVSGLLNLGSSNAFFGAKAGQENKQGSENSFFGAYAGQNNITGSNNSFFGYFAGNGTTSGNENSFFGNRSGQVNTTGAFNSFFGTFTGLFNSSGSDNSFFGNSAGYNNTVGNRNSFFGSSAGRENSSGTDNAFLGSFAGNANTSGNNNSFVGSRAGQQNATGINNSFVGAGSGFTNTASNNSFFGAEAGHFNTTGANNTFLGRNAGRDNLSGELNVFVGVNAGNSNTLGRNNTIIGAEADVLGTNLSYATAIGAEAVVNTSNTLVLGRPADQVRVPGAMNITGNLNVAGTLSATNLSISATNITGVVGTANGGTGLSSPGLAGRFLRSDGTNWQSQPLLATDLPSGSTSYIQNSTTQQGSSNFNISGNGTAGGTLTGNAVNSVTQYNIGGNRVLSSPGLSNLFAGVTAGNANMGGTSNSFFGNSAGAQNSSGNSNSFFGASAGLNSSTGGNNTFAGANSGAGNAAGGNNSFFGVNAGQANTIGNNNTVIGANANVGANNLSYATAVGADAMVSTNNTVVLGRNVDTVRAPGNLQVDGTLTANNFSIPASNLTGTVAVANGGTGMSASGASGNYLRSNGSIWISSAIPASDLPAGSTNYIQNGTTPQAAANFNVGGSGTIGGNLTVAGAINGSLAAANLTGTVGVSNGGTGLSSAGTSGHFLKSNGTGFTTSALLAADIPNLAASYVQNGTTPQAGANFNIGGNGTIGGNLNVGGTISGTFSVPASNITGTLGMANGGTGVTSSGVAGNVLRSNGTTWQAAPLTASDIPSLAANYIQNGSTPQAGANFNVGGNGTIGGNLTVGGAINGSLATSNLSGTVGVSNGGTGLTSAGTSGHFLKSNGIGFTTSALSASDIPSLAASYVQNGTTPQAGANFNVGGNGTIGGNLTVGGTISGTFSVPATSITGTLGVANGGTGLSSAGTSGHFLKSTGTGFSTSALSASEIPAGSANYVQNGTTPQAATNFNIAGSGTIGTNLTVGGNLTVNGTLGGSFNVPAANITGTVSAANGGTGLTASTGTQFLRGNGSGGWTSGALTAGDIPSLGGTYIQNGTTQQASSNFNVSGSGEVGTTMTVGTTLTANTVNSVTQYNINGNRVFATNGSNNVFAGEGTGNTGSSNAFFGSSAGNANTTGTSNTIVGADADVGTGNLTNATAIGANATVTQSNSVVLGGVTGVNGGTDARVGIGTTAPKAKLEVTGGDILIGSPGQGILLKSPNGMVCKLFRLKDDGTTELVTVTCP